MKLTAIILLGAFLQVSAKGFGQQSVTLSEKNVSIKQIFREINRQTGYKFFYEEELVRRAGKININVKNASIDEVLKTCFRNLPFEYSIEENTIVVKPLAKKPEEKAEPAAYIDARGVVTDENGKPLAGASVKLKGTDKGTTTDASGNFLLQIPGKGGKLIISYVGYETLELAVSKTGDLRIVLKPAESKIEEVVVVGYGTQKKVSLTTAVSTIKPGEMANIPTSNSSNLLSGKAPGLFVQSQTGVPGISSAVRIRSTSSWNGGSPLYVIDGVVRDQAAFDALDPNEIDNLSILRDAASAAIYGSRSANGALLITTKKGKKSNKSAISFSAIYGVYSAPAIMGQYMDEDASIHLYNTMYPNKPVNSWDNAWIRENNYNNKAWYDAAYQNPYNQKYNMNVSGGSENVTYFLNGSLFDEQGFLPQLHYFKYNIRGNVQANISKSLTVGLNLNTSSGIRKRFTSELMGNNADLSGYYEKLHYIGGGYILPYIDGKPVSVDWSGGNAVEVMKNGGYWHNTDQLLDAVLNIEYKVPFVKGLSVKGLYSSNSDFNRVKTYSIKPTMYKFAPDPQSSIGIFSNTVTGSAVVSRPTLPYIGNHSCPTKKA